MSWRVNKRIIKHNILSRSDVERKNPHHRSNEEINVINTNRRHSTDWGNIYTNRRHSTDCGSNQLWLSRKRSTQPLFKRENHQQNRGCSEKSTGLGSSSVLLPKLRWKKTQNFNDWRGKLVSKREGTDWT